MTNNTANGGSRIGEVEGVGVIPTPTPPFFPGTISSAGGLPPYSYGAYTPLKDRRSGRFSGTGTLLQPTTDGLSRPSYSPSMRNSTSFYSTYSIVSTATMSFAQRRRLHRRTHNSLNSNGSTTTHPTNPFGALMHPEATLSTPIPPTRPSLLTTTPLYNQPSTPAAAASVAKRILETLHSLTTPIEEVSNRCRWLVVVSAVQIECNTMNPILTLG